MFGSAKRKHDVLFNSYEFLFGFFPVTFAGFFVLGRRSRNIAAAWLGVCSLLFYSWTSAKAVPLLLVSICVNYLLSKQLSEGRALVDAATQATARRARRLVLFAGVCFNLAILGFFKYANFFIANLNAVVGTTHGAAISALHIALPTGISFYTFTQIAFLVDCWQDKVKERNFIHYLLFVTYFPHLIAGPVLHHKQMMPQFANVETYRPKARGIAMGALIFVLGLGKKVLLADPLGSHADALFDHVGAGAALDFLASWLGVLAYTFQIYFDFSGYSDMAIGLSLFFGIQLPINFNSPYKARSAIDFWRRWHISLSTFLRDYLYIPLGGNRLGIFRRYANLFITMLLGGLWHGASWTFVLWGAAHGGFLIVNHAWQRLVGTNRDYGPLGESLCWVLTFVGVCAAWVLFRASDATTALRIYEGLLGFNGLGALRATPEQIGFTFAAALLSMFASNVSELRASIEREAEPPRRSISLLAGAAVGVVFFVSLVFLRARSTFIYFNF